jgi:predicted permease
MFWRRKRHDFSEEIRSHLQLEADRLRESGLSDSEAEDAARREFGNVTLAQERYFEAGRAMWWDHLARDVKYAFRLMRKNRVLSTTMVLTLALGIGANSVVFSVVRAVLLRPLEYANPAQLVQLWDSGTRTGGQGDWVSFPDFRDWRSENRVFQEMAAYRYSLSTITGIGEAESILGLQATDRLFATLGVQPLLGRTFFSGEDQPGHENVAVISAALWKRHFGGDPAVCGKTMGVDRMSYTVIGVMPASFHFPASVPVDSAAVPIDIWLPMRHNAGMEERGSHNYWAIARLKPGVTLQQARANMRSVAANIAREHPDSNEGMGATVVFLRDHLIEGVHNALLILLGAVGTVLLLGCMNIASILLSRAESRRREVAIRQALGAGRGRLIRQNMTESVLLACIGGAAGLGLAYAGIRIAISLAPANIPRIQQTSIDTQVVLFTALVSLLVGVLFGLAPALLAVGSDTQTSLKESETRSTANRAHLTVRHLLIGGQMALAVLLLVAAGLLIRSFVNVTRLDPGFRPKQVLIGYINLVGTRYGADSKRATFFEKALRRIRELPGVRSVAVGDSVPLTGENDQGGFRIEGRPAPPVGDDGPHANRPRVSVDYFKTMGIQLLKGRLFNEHDVSDSPYVAVISDLAARTYWPSENPIGKRITVDSVDGKPVWRQIVGIVRSTRHFGLEEPPKPEIICRKPRLHPRL